MLILIGISSLLYETPEFFSSPPLIQYPKLTSSRHLIFSAIKPFNLESSIFTLEHTEVSFCELAIKEIT